MASAGTRATALLFSFSFSAIIFLLLLLQAPGLLVSALDRLLDGRGLLEVLATRRNMILLCHAILLLILRDAGLLGAPAASRRSRSPPAPGEATVAAAGTVEISTRSAVVWRRRPRNRAVVATHDAAAAAARRLVEYRPAAAEEAAAVATKQIVVAETPRNDDRHDPAAAVEPLEHPTATAADDGERGDCDDRRVIATAREQQTAGMELEMELADDRTFEEFIESQRRQMRQESLQLVSSAGYHYHYQAIAAACY